MSKKIDPTESAFPCDQDQFQVGTEGLTKREYFAAQAMVAAMAVNVDGDIDPKETGRQAVKCADALIAALNESGGEDG